MQKAPICKAHKAHPDYFDAGIFRNMSYDIDRVVLAV